MIILQVTFIWTAYKSIHIKLKINLSNEISQKRMVAETIFLSVKSYVSGKEVVRHGITKKSHLRVMTSNGRNNAHGEFSGFVSKQMMQM